MAEFAMYTGMYPMWKLVSGLLAVEDDMLIQSYNWISRLWGYFVVPCFSEEKVKISETTYIPIVYDELMLLFKKQWISLTFLSYLCYIRNLND